MTSPRIPKETSPRKSPPVNQKHLFLIQLSPQPPCLPRAILPKKKRASVRKISNYPLEAEGEQQRRGDVPILRGHQVPTQTHLKIYTKAIKNHTGKNRYNCLL